MMPWLAVMRVRIGLLVGSPSMLATRIMRVKSMASSAEGGT